MALYVPATDYAPNCLWYCLMFSKKKKKNLDADTKFRHTDDI